MGVTELNPTTGYLRAQPLDAGQIAQALPLVRSVRADLTLCDWRSYCAAAQSQPGGGIECVVDEKGYLLGLMVYRRDPDIRHRAVLTVDPFIAVDLYGRDEAARRMLIRIEALAEEHGCGAVHIALEGVDGRFPKRCGGSFSRFLEDGYHAEGLRLCKPV